MSDMLGYEPIIREGGADDETRKRLGDPGDPYPYVQIGDHKVYDVEDIVVCQENYIKNDKELTNLIYESVSMSNELYNLFNLRHYLKAKGLTENYQKYMNDVHHKTYTSALEAMDDTNQAIRSIFNKLTEYIRKVSQSYSHWVRDTADIHQRTLSAMVDLEQEYRKCYLNRKEQFEHLIIDINDGGCPKAAALEVIFERCTDVLTILNDVKNDVNGVLYKLAVKAKEVYKTGDTSALDEMLNNNEESIDGDMLDKFTAIQDKFTSIGMNFSEDMAAAFEDVLEYRDDNLKTLGYEEDTYKKIIKIIHKKEHIEKCKYLSDLLNSSSTYFSSININSSSETNNNENTSDEDTDKYDAYINIIPKILTIVISIYRTVIMATREYSTIALNIEKTIVENTR